MTVPSAPFKPRRCQWRRARKLDKATYAKVVNYCLRVAKGDALIKIADGKVSAVHGGDKHDYCILDMKAMF